MEQVINLRFFGSLGFAASLLLFTPNQAFAKAEICAPHYAMTQVLEESYAEQPTNLALDANGNLIEFYRSKKGSWTVLVVSPPGQACVLSTGDAWVTLTPANDTTS